jgi:hypothetical protein
MKLDESFAESNLLDRICELVSRVRLGGGLGTSLNHLKRPGVNRAGEGLELWVKHFLAGTIGHADEENIREIWNQCLSFHGGTNNPPDVMIRNSIAAEVKKTESASGALQLNSSWPIRVLLRDDAHITQECRDAETWTEKPFLFIVGQVNPMTKSLLALWIVDGRCLADDETVYSSLMAKARASMLTLGGDATREIGKFNSVDSLRRTALRVRPMFALNHPAKIFEIIFQQQGTKQFILNVLIPTSSYLNFSESQRAKISELDENLVIRDLEIQDPTDRTMLMNATLISGSW